MFPTLKVSFNVVAPETFNESDSPTVPTTAKSSLKVASPATLKVKSSIVAPETLRVPFKSAEAISKFPLVPENTSDVLVASVNKVNLDASVSYIWYFQYLEEIYVMFRLFEEIQ